MKIILTLLASAFFSAFSFCQSWNIIEHQELFSIFVSELDYKNSQDGINHKRYVFKYENHSNEEISLVFNRELNYQGVKISQEQTFQVSIPPGSSIEYNDENRDKTFYIFKEDLSRTIKKSLTDFKLINLRTL